MGDDVTKLKEEIERLNKEKELFVQGKSKLARPRVRRKDANIIVLVDGKKFPVTLNYTQWKQIFTERKDEILRLHNEIANEMKGVKHMPEAKPDTVKEIGERIEKEIPAKPKGKLVQAKITVKE